MHAVPNLRVSRVLVLFLVMIGFATLLTGCGREEAKAPATQQAPHAGGRTQVDA